MILKGMTQEQVREAICKALHDAQHSLALAGDMMPNLEAHNAFVSLAKVNADNLATMAANLESRIKFLK